MEQCKQRDVSTKYNYLKADYISISSKLNEMHWDILLSNESIDVTVIADMLFKETTDNQL